MCDPLHGVTLERIVSHLHAEYGWDELAHRIPVKCFQQNPSVSSSLKFLRKTPWAREQVEAEFVRLSHKEDSNSLVAHVKRGESEELLATLLEGEFSQTKAHQALVWCIHHLPQTKQNLELYFLPILNNVQDVNFWPDSETMPLLNLAIEHSKLGAGDYDLGLIRALLQRGAQPSDSRYWPPLLHTVDVEGQAYKGRTRAPRTDILDLLLNHGATPELSDSQGHTGLQMAQAYHLKAFINKLRPNI